MDQLPRIPLFPNVGRQRSPDLPVAWQPGEHVAVVGDTGSGKTYLIAKLAMMRRYVAMLRTKPDDIEFPGFEQSQTSKAMAYWDASRVLIAPKLSLQAKEVWHALRQTWEDGGWTTIVDELWYAEHRLGLRNDIENLLTQGRSKDITMVVGMQRPSQVSRFAIAECTHLFCFRLDGRDAKTVAEASKPQMRFAVEQLTGHDFAYFHRGKRIIQIGNANDLGAIFSNAASKHLTHATSRRTMRAL
jgi:ABC-type dipeptide/oligopeptide/nickel transport system ATPase component